ncbi:hypothetical protein QR680_017532 [Steinernema hermaphroditum]|uniref:BEACH-type PH domain-containing protein n=1 Tax=Steinernema hermaphroditum TaxID=289476 RepID=A0AA39LPH2_9BILA|nr:hypothetical protein QR680_017532 [Steinernema hermaphroditum]
MVERERFAVTGWLSTLVRSLVNILDAEPIDRDLSSLTYILRILAESEVPEGLKDSLGEELFATLSSHVETLTDIEEDVSSSFADFLARTISPVLPGFKPLKRRRRFFSRKKASIHRWGVSENDSESDESDAPSAGAYSAEHRFALQPKNLLFSDSDGLSAIYAETHSFIANDPLSVSLSVATKLQSIFPVAECHGSLRSHTLEFRLSMFVLARFMNDDNRRRMLISLAEKTFGGMQFRSMQSVAFALDFLSYLIMKSLTKNLEDSDFIERANLLLLEMIRKILDSGIGEVHEATTCATIRRLVSRCLRVFIITWYRGFPTNKEDLLQTIVPFLASRASTVIEEFGRLRCFIRHSPEPGKCCCNFVFSLLLSISADDECKRELTTFLLSTSNLFACSCINTGDVLQLLCTLIGSQHVSESTASVASLLIRSRTRESASVSPAFSVFDPLVSCFETDCNVFDISFLNDVLSALPSVDDVSYLLESCVLHNLVRISQQEDENAIEDDQEVFQELMKVLVTFMDTSVCCLTISEVVMSHMQTFLSLTVSSSIFPVAVSRLIQKATSDRSNDLMQVMYKQFEESLRVAASDIWLLVSASATLFFKRLVGFLELFNILKEVVNVELSSKLCSDSQRLVNLCCEYISSPLKEFRSNSRLSQLLALSLRLSTEPLFEKVVGVVNESAKSAHYSLLCTLSSAFLEVVQENSSLKTVVQTDLEPRECCAKPGDESDFDESEACDEENDVAFTSIENNCDFLLLAIDCIFAFVKKYSKLEEGLEHCVKSFADRLRTFKFSNLERLKEVIEKMLDLCDECVAKDVLSATFDSLMFSLFHLIQQRSCPEQVYRMFRMLDYSPHLQTSLFKALDRVFKTHRYQSSSLLRFPIYSSHPSVIKLQKESYITQKSERPRKPNRNTSVLPRSFTVIETLERLLVGGSRASELDLTSLDGQSSTPRKEEDNFFVSSAAASLSFDTANRTSFAEGLSASFWLKVTEDENSDLVHIVSIGSSFIHVSLFVIPDNKRIVLTITMNGMVVARKSLKRHVFSQKWTHVVLSFRVVESQVSSQLLLGDSIHELTYDIVTDERNSAVGYSSVAFGAVTGDRHCQWNYEITSIFGFKGVLSPTAALVLRGFGFQVNSITRCLSDCQQTSRLPFVFTKKILCSKRIHFDALLNDSEKFVQILQRCLLFVFNCEKPEVYGLSGLQPGVNSHLLEEVRRDGDSAMFSLIAFREFPITWKAASLQVTVDSGIDSALYSLGSIKLLLFYYAQSVDLSLDSDAQLITLRTLLKSLQRDPRNYSKFNHLGGASIVAAILSSPRASVDWDVLYELASFLTSDVERSEDGTTSVGLTSAILDPDFLTLFVNSPKIWKRHRLSYWVELVKIVACCIREDTKFGDFNSLQLKRVNFLENMLHAVVYMMQSPADYCLWECDGVLIDSFVTLIRRLIGSPASADTVISLWNFILLSHTAANTYIVSNIQGYNDWLRIDSMRCSDMEPVILGETPLSALLSNIYETLGKNRVSEVWKKTMSVTAVRKVYRECLNVHNGTGRRRTDSTLSSFDSSVTDASNSSRESEISTCENLHIEGAQEKVESTGPRVDEMEVMNSGTAWMTDLRSGILEILCSLLVTGSDDLMKVLFSHAAFRWESVLVMLTSQADPRIRDSVFVFLHNFFLRCSPSVRLSFIASDGFVLLGNQMRNHQVSETIADSLYGIMCRSAVKLSDGLDEHHLKSLNVDRFTCASFHSIFVCFEESVSNNALFWNIGGALQKIFECNSILMQAMMDSGLVETLSSVLYRISKLPDDGDCDVFGVHYLTNRGEMWLSFACRIISQCVPYDELSLYNKCEELIWLTIMTDWQASQDDINARFVREQVSGLLLHWINSISSSVQKEGRSASTIPSLEDIHLASSEAGSLSDEFEILSMESITARHFDPTSSDSPSFISQSLSDFKERFLGTKNVTKLLKVKYKWKMQMVLANPTDLSHRVCFALEMASHLFACLALPKVPSDIEMELFQLVLTIFCSSWRTESFVHKRSPRRNGIDHPVTWSGLLTISRDRVHVLFAQLIAFALYPAQMKCRILSGEHCEDSESNYVANRQFSIVASLCYEVNCKQMLRTLLDINLDGQYAMNVALHEMALFPGESDERRDRCIDQLVTFLRNVQIESPFANLSFDGISSLIQDEIISLHNYSSHRKTFFDRMRSKATEIVDRESKATDRISMDAMGVTCTVSQNNIPRKSFVRHLRHLENKYYSAEKALTTLTNELAHQEGCALRRKAWFGGWALDATEGPNRERRRLSPAHPMYSDRFVLEPYRETLRSREHGTPLESLTHNTSADLRLNEVEISEGIRYSVGATVVRSTFECSGEVLLGDSKLYFFGETAKSTQKGTQCSVITFSWHYSEVSRFFKRCFLLEENALEIFLFSGDAYLIVFSSPEVRGVFLSHLTQMPMRHLSSSLSSDSAESNLHNLTHRWRMGAMTNFEYIMHLNTLAGRSHNDLMQYPIAPFIIADFRSVVLDLEAPSTYRNLSKPMAIQDKTMEEHYLRNFHCLETESRRTSADAGANIVNFGPYHYGSHYSNSGIVVHYLVRLSPFTNIALEYQDNNFDIADRLFNSIETTWRLASKESTTDFKEAIPEFYYLPEFLQNLNGLDLGVKQNGDRVDNVILPQWCPHRETPLGYRLFCFIHRQALESNVVTSGLHSWIDLIFGYKQTGDAAVKAINVFHPATYRDKRFELNGTLKHDELSMSALRTMVRSYGQMPTQLFSSPHLPHLNPKYPNTGERLKVPSNLFNTVSGLQWGDFLGSPCGTSGRISNVMTVQIHEKIECLFVFPDNVASCGGLPPKTAIWYKPGASKNYDDQPLSESRGVISWNFFDNVLRFKLVKTDDSVWVNLVDFGILKVTSVAVSYAKSSVFVGFACGVVHVYHLEVTSSGFALCSLKNELFAHRMAVATISVCDEFGFAVTTDRSGKVCFWDLNKLTFIRSHRCPRAISLSYVSPTTGDVALVSTSPEGQQVESTVTLLTINGFVVGTLTLPEKVTSLTMSMLAEGRAINCLLLGMYDGTIRVLEMWTLTEVNLIDQSFSDEIVSMQFSSHCKKLYTLLKSGYIHCLQCASGNRGKPPSFHLINPF